jgi:TonB family protein
MLAHRLRGCAVGRLFLVLVWLASVLDSRCVAQQHHLLPDRTEQPRTQIAGLAERLAAELVAADKKRPFLLDLTLPDDVHCPLGAWLADRISELLAQSHPELEVIPRHLWQSAREPAEPAHDHNQAYALDEQRAQSLGAEVLVRGNFAAIPDGIGITLLGSDRLAGGESRFEALAEIPVTPEMQALVASPLPERAKLQGAFKAGVAGIGSPTCDVCPAPEYTYMAKAKKLTGVVIAQVLVGENGMTESVQIVRAPSSALGDAALRGVRNWRFKPARNFQGKSIPAVVNVAVSFRLDVFLPQGVSNISSGVSKKF